MWKSKGGEHGYRVSLCVNDRKFSQVLRFLSLIDDSNSPTEAYRKTLRGGQQGRAEMAQLVRQSYADLFATYPDAHRKDNEALQNFFMAHTDLGSKAVQSMALTFKSVCSFAEFEADATVTPAEKESKDPQDIGNDSAEPVNIALNGKPSTINTSNHPLTINVNIQLELPATSETDVYEALFASMAKHIMRLPKTE